MIAGPSYSAPSGSAKERVEREDLLMFVSACFACTGQREFYSDGRGQAVSIDFLHRYVLGNYRSLYARTLTLGVNDFNQALIVSNLLSTGKSTTPSERSLENALVTRALARLPVHRAMHLLEALAKRRVNNRRTRAIIAAFLASPDQRDFRAVKYRRAFRRAAHHAHVGLGGELAPFFQNGWRERVYQTPLLESFRQAHFAESKLYDLPFSIAEGLAAKHRVPRDVFLRRIEPRLTANERLRLQDASREALGKAYAIDETRLSPTKLASFILSRDDREEQRASLHEALLLSTRRAVSRTASRFGKVACVLDRSYSSSGSNEKRRRPLAVALAVSYFLREASREYRAFWTAPTADEVLVDARGATDLATPILDALDWAPELLILVSDGFDNDPPGVAAQVLELAQKNLRAAPLCVHLNPVFDAESFAPKALGAGAVTMGIRAAEDLPTAVALASFAEARASLSDLVAHLDGRTERFLATDRKMHEASP